MKKKIPRGLYAVTDPLLLPDERLVSGVAAAIQGGAVMVQYRDKGSDRDRRLWEVQDLLTLCRPLSVPLIINDDVELAREADADGVHLGQGDMAIGAARALLGDAAIIGITCHNSLDLARDAEAAGADYVAFGSFFPSPTKPDAVRADIDLLRRARREIALPIAVIGGITADNGTALIEAGADLLAVINDLFGHRDVAAAARCLASLFR